MNAEAEIFLDDFETEARTHIEKIETSFLEPESIANDAQQMNSVFRAAHSLKGTAGFFSLTKIVAIAHELESVFSQIKDDKLIISDEITDVVLQSVDCLRDLVDNLRNDESIEISTVIEAIKKYSNVEKPPKAAEDAVKIIEIPFDCENPGTASALMAAARHGHKIYYVNIMFNRGLGKYYKHPEGMLDSILSIGDITEAIVNGQSENILRDNDPKTITQKIILALSERDTSTLELLITSVLEFELFAIAIEIDKKHIYPLARESVFGPRKSDPGDAPDRAAFAESGEDAAAIGNDNSANGAQPASGSARMQGSDFLIHLDISVINSLLDLANEMVLTRNQLLSTTSDHKKSIVGLTPILQDMNRLTSEIQEKVMLTRMQPISVIFSKFPRIIRDTAKALNKEIEIVIMGGEVTLDKYLLDAITDPITQLVKNSADHGVETAERRAELGKPIKGKITLNTYMRDGSAVIEVMDDGAGINIEAVKQKAIERGIVTEEALSTMQDNEIYELILEPGFSTAKQVTNLSGRGVGMDIVKTNIEKLGGSIEIESEPDRGSIMRLRMPLTLSVVRALIIVIDNIQYAVPETNVERIIRIGRTMQTRRLERVNDSLILVLGPRIIPVITMDEICAKARGQEPPQAAALLEKCMERDVNKCLILKAGDSTFALLIDDAKDTEQTLVKPLPKFFRNCLCYSSVTVLGTGNAIAILDAEGILRLMGVKGSAKESSYKEYAEPESSQDKQYILFKCSGTEYFALETSEILRIESIDPSQIQEIGNGRFINIAGETIRIVRPENYAPVKSRRYVEDKLFLLTLKHSASPVGLLAGKVIDKVEAAFKYDKDRVASDFIFGTSTYNEKIIIFLDPAAISAEIENDKMKKKKVANARLSVEEGLS